ncbi:MAG: isopentenyl transferase family protein [Bdellovibrionales bacterium]
MIPLIFICGPTCSGKTSLALHLAQKYAGEILNVDSVQLFAGVNIGYGKAHERRVKMSSPSFEGRRDSRG